MSEDRFTHTEADAGEYERHRAEPDYDRPSRSDLADEERAGTLRHAASEIAKSFPYNGELRTDGSEDPLAAAYVEGLHDAWEIVSSLVCDLSDLPVDQCACRIHKPESRRTWTRSAFGMLARYHTRLTCDHWAAIGDPIVRTEEGDWICEECADA